MLFSGELFLGVDTGIVPAYLGYGVVEGGRSDLYLFNGRLFRSRARD